MNEKKKKRGALCHAAAPLKAVHRAGPNSLNTELRNLGVLREFAVARDANFTESEDIYVA